MAQRPSVLAAGLIWRICRFVIGNFYVCHFFPTFIMSDVCVKDNVNSLDISDVLISLEQLHGRM